MVAVLQHRRDTTANRLATIPSSAELFWDLTTGGLWVGDDVTNGGMAVSGFRKNAQTGTTYTVLNSDAGKLITLFNAAPVVVTLPQAGSVSGTFFPDQTGFCILNLGAGIVTITSTISTINNQATLVLAQYQGAKIFSDGSSYFALIGTAINGGVPGITTLTKTSNYTILATDNLKHFNNIGAGAQVDLTLPTAVAGLQYTFVVFEAQTLKILRAASDVIKGGTTFSANSIESNEPYSALTLEAHGTGLWVSTSTTGNWLG